MGCPKLAYDLSSKPRLRCVYNAADGEKEYAVYPEPAERSKMTVSGSTANYTRVYIGGNYEHEKNGNTTTERLYLGGTPYSAPSVAIRTNSGAWQLHYIHRDHIGSIVAVSDANGNASGNTGETRSYDAWGRLRDPSTLQPFAYNAQPTLLLRRGYTGHERLPEFGLINMNARLYDPVTGRFLSPDPYVQAPDFSQSYNRYSYCINNPLIYTDPSGELLGFGFLVGFWRGVFTWQNPFKTSWETGVNQFKIWGGLFAADTKQSGWGWQIVSRFTWELPQTALGFGFTQISNLAGQVDKVAYYAGATVSSGNFWGNDQAVTMGSFITGSRDLAADPNNSLFQHEYGHVLQSREMGWAYFPRVGVPSLFSDASTHKYQHFEQDANRRAFMYFNKNVDRFYKSQRDQNEFGNTRGWNFRENPLDVNHTATRGVYYDYHNPEHRALINSLALRAKWYDYYIPFWHYIGIGNALYYRNNRVK